MKDHKVGYRRPPKHTQFKPGVSGNKKGRKPEATTLKTAIRHELASKVSLKEDGETKTVSKMEALAKRLVAGALAGNPRALSELLRQINLHLPSSEPTEDAELPASEEDRQLLLEFAKRALMQMGEKSKDNDDGDEI